MQPAALLVQMMETLHLESPAKINLRLEILRKREDGYHELRTVLQKISLHDLLHFSLKKQKGLSITTEHPDLPVGKGNLVYQAVRSILKKSEYRGGVVVEIEKKIPLGAGLGGGSSDAATALMAMNQLLKTNLPKKELMRMALEIGADVPFFVFDRPAIASGIGERLKRIELPELWYVLIYPNFEVSTHWAYQHFLLTKRTFHINLHKLLRTPQDISQILWNDLEEVVSGEYPQIGEMKKMLYAVGALGASMTGSGPTVFGVFAEEGGATEAYKRIKRMIRSRGWVALKGHSIRT